MPKKKLTIDIAKELLILASKYHDIDKVAKESGFSLRLINQWLSEDNTFREHFNTRLNKKNYQIFEWLNYWQDSGVKSSVEKFLLGTLERGWRKEKVITKTRRDADGNIIFTDTTTEVTKEPPPKWILEMISPKQFDIIAVLSQLVQAGIYTDDQLEIYVRNNENLNEELAKFAERCLTKQLSLDLQDVNFE